MLGHGADEAPRGARGTRHGCEPPRHHGPGGRHHGRFGGAAEPGHGEPEHGRRAHGRHGAGPWDFGPPWGGQWGRGGPWGRRGPWGRGPRVGRGDVRAAALLLLAEQPMHGYQLIQELERRSGGVWRPSPGSVYPALQQLEDEGLVRASETEGRRIYHLTDEGTEYVRTNADALGTPWQSVGSTVDDGLLELRDLVMQAGAAVMQVAQAGTPAQVAEARKVLADTRRALYRILAENGTGAGSAEPSGDRA